MSKKQTLLLFLSIILSIGCCFGQNKVDSLKKVLQFASEDTTKVNTLIALSRTYLDSSPEEATRYSLKAKTLAEKVGFQKGLAFSLKYLGLINYRQGKYLEALDYWNQSLKVFEISNLKSGQANILQNLGTIYFDQADDEKALNYFLKAQKVAEEIGDTLRIAEILGNIGAIYGKKTATYDKAIDYDLRALKINEQIENTDAIGTITSNLGEIFLLKNDDSTALVYFERSLKAYKLIGQEGSGNIPYSLNNIGRVFKKRGEYDKAIEKHSEAFEKAKSVDSKLDMAQSLLRLGDVYQEKGDAKLAIVTYEKAKDFAKGINANVELKDIYQGLSISYSDIKDFGNAFKYQNLLISIKDVLYNIETDKKLGSISFNYEIEKKQGQINLLTKDKKLQELDLQKQKIAKNAFLTGLILILIIAFIIFRNYRAKVKINKILDTQKVEIETLLLNILPAEVAKELQTDGHAKPRFYESVSVLFTDFKGFTTIAEGLTPNELVEELNDFFVAFDDIIEKNNLEKIKTIGDAYMCAGGIPTENTTHPIDIINAGIEIQQYIYDRNEKRKVAGQVLWHLRVGIHTGPVVAGVVGKKKYAYDIWGDTVNVASRMESSGEAGKVNISGTTYELIKDNFSCVHRGKIQAKNKGEIDMYFIKHSLS